MTGLVVILQQVAAEMAGEIPPHAMDVIGSVLRVIELDEEGLSFKAVSAVEEIAAFVRRVPGIEAQRVRG